MSFENLGLIDPLLRAVREEGYDEPMPIQVQAVPHILAGRDLIGCAQTGTGKTAAFALPIIQRLVERAGPKNARPLLRVLILTPTRELATQIGDSFAAYGRHTGIKYTVIFGGVGQTRQVRALRKGVEVVVATPGRLLDLMGQGRIQLRDLKIFVLDEADRMLDMGFIPDVKRIVASLPEERQTLFFSATMPRDMVRLAGSIVRDPVHVEAAPTATTVDAVEQRVYHVVRSKKRNLLEHLLKTDPGISRALVFSRTKHGADRIARQLAHADVNSQAIHGNKSQSARERALAAFKAGRTRVLVATDIAARGIDIDSVSHVINFDLPHVAESYVHRIGRTARAGAAGVALSFCSVEERGLLAGIEKLIRMKLGVVSDHPYPVSASERGAKVAPASKTARRSGGQNKSRR